MSDVSAVGSHSLDIQVIVGNPPYSVGQGSQNDDNQNLTYPTLDSSIAQSYVAESDAGLNKSLYDSYVRAIRWASNRILSSPDGGVVGFVTNGGWLDSNSGKGIRTVLAREFHHLYVFNLRGNARTSGEERRRERDNVFESASRNTVAITLLVKEAGPVPEGGGRIHYCDIGDYLSRDEKLAIVDDATIDGTTWTEITPNEHHDWLNQRDPAYDQLVPLAGEPDAIFGLQSLGLVTSRDKWVYHSSERELRANVDRMIDHYNAQADAFTAAHPPTGETKNARAAKAKNFVDKDPTRYSWAANDYPRVSNAQTYRLGDDMVRTGLYRPFFKQHVAFDSQFNTRQGQLPKLYPTPTATNLGFSLVGTGTSVPFGAIATDTIAQLHMIGASSSTQHFARWQYENPGGDTLLGGSEDGRVSNLNPAGVDRFRSALGSDIDDDAVFFYVYGVLHSPEYLARFEANLKKEPPRVPLPTGRATFDAFAEAGKALCDLHVGYEQAEPWALVEEWRDGVDPAASPEVLLVDKKMKFPTSKDPDTGEKVVDRSQLVYNPFLTLSGIPPEAHEYVLGTRSGIEWLIDRYYVKTDKASGIRNDPNAWGLEQGNPRYIIDLIKRVTTVSVRTVEIVDSLPTLEFEG